MSGSGIVRYLIVGNSAAGLAAAQAIRGLDPLSPITILSDETGWAYSRVSLSWLVKGTLSQESLFFRKADFYGRWGIDLESGQRVVQVSPTEQNVHTAAGRVYPYDRLLIATGSRAQRLAVDGSTLEGIFVLRNLPDAEAIGARARNARAAVVVGGGLVGVKSAEALAHRGLRVRMVVSSDRVLSQVLNPEAALLASARLQSLGIEVQYRTDVEQFDGDGGQLESVLLSDGSRVQSEVAVMAKGVVPNMEIVAGTGIATRRGILVDGRQQASIPGVYAAGDVAESVELLTGGSDICPNWPTALRQGQVAGTNMAGGDLVYSGNLRANVTAIGGLSLGSAGDVSGKDNASVYSRGPDGRGNGCWLYVRDQRLVGAVLSGDITGLHCMEWLIRNRQLLRVPIDSLLTQPQHYILHVQGHSQEYHAQ